jgi:hypothetical protein
MHRGAVVISPLPIVFSFAAPELRKYVLRRVHGHLISPTPDDLQCCTDAQNKRHVRCRGSKLSWLDPHWSTKYYKLKNIYIKKKFMKWTPYCHATPPMEFKIYY